MITSPGLSPAFVRGRVGLDGADGVIVGDQVGEGEAGGGLIAMLDEGLLRGMPDSGNGMAGQLGQATSP